MDYSRKIIQELNRRNLYYDYDRLQKMIEYLTKLSHAKLREIARTPGDPIWWVSALVITGCSEEPVTTKKQGDWIIDTFDDGDVLKSSSSSSSQLYQAKT